MDRKMFFLAVMFGSLLGFGISGEAREEVRGANSARKILVVYGTRSGSTAEVAEAICKTLSAGAGGAEVRPVDQVQNLSGYDAIVIGSAIRAGKVMGEVNNFVNSHRSELQNKRVAYFLVCMTMKDDTPENRKKADAYLDPLRKLVTPVDVGLFAGKMDYTKLGLADRFIVKRLVKVPEGDFWNWKAIDSWARELRSKL